MPPPVTRATLPVMSIALVKLVLILYWYQAIFLWRCVDNLPSSWNACFYKRTNPTTLVSHRRDYVFSITKLEENSELAANQRGGLSGPQGCPHGSWVKQRERNPVGTTNRELSLFTVASIPFRVYQETIAFLIPTPNHRCDTASEKVRMTRRWFLVV